MRHIRSALLSAILAIGLSAAGAAAQAGGPPAGGRSGGMMQMLLKGITLSDSQQTQIQAIQAKYEPQLQSLRQQMRDARQSGGQMDPSTMATMRETSQKERSEIRAVLTPDQQATFDENLKNMPRRGGRGPN